MLKLLSLYSFIVFISSSISLTATAQNKKTEKFINQYLKVAVKNRGNIPGVMSRWGKDTVTYRIFGELPFMSKKDWNKFVNEVSQLTDIVFLPTDQTQSDILIYFGTIRGFAEYTNASIPQSVINQYNSWNTRQRSGVTGDLKFASGCTDPDKPRVIYKGVADVKSLFLSAIGLYSTLDDEYSLLNGGQFAGTVKLSRNDKRLIKMHYHPSLKSGLDRKTLRATLRSIDNIDELAKEKL
ncbi:MAG: hypothetical protein WBA74_15545 [Cyclobacteriaceae bacterium]